MCKIIILSIEIQISSKYMCTNLVLYLQKHIFVNSNVDENGCSK